MILLIESMSRGSSLPSGKVDCQPNRSEAGYDEGYDQKRPVAGKAFPIFPFFPSQRKQSSAIGIPLVNSGLRLPLGREDKEKSMKNRSSARWLSGFLIGSVLLGCSTLTFAGGSPTPASRAGGGEHIAFTSDRDGNSEIYVMGRDGGDPVRLTDNPAADSSPSWSPDGGRMAFKSERDGNAEIYVMNADGGAVTRLTDNPAMDGSPAFSPDGKRIAFESSRDDPNPVGCWPYDCMIGIYVMDADGGNVIRLSDQPVRDSKPAWSPDGTRIAFSSTRDDGSPIACQPECNYEIYIMDADGKNATRLTDHPERDTQPAFSPDGRQIAFASNRDGNWNLFAMDTGGGNVARWTGDTADDEQPAWSPDGGRIVFMSRRDGDWDIYVMASGGGKATRLTENPADDWDAAWQP
jgi:Tol biopolymer transport system component